VKTNSLLDIYYHTEKISTIFTFNLQVKQVWHTRVSGHHTISTAIHRGATAALPRTIDASSHHKNVGRTAPGHAAHSRRAPPCSHQPGK